MNSIDVEPERLEAAASKVENADSDYQRYYQAIYSEVDKMSSHWQGKDNVAFTNQIKAFEDDLKRISMVMREYADFLRDAARSYRQMQEENYAQANKLKTL